MKPKKPNGFEENQTKPKKADNEDEEDKEDVNDNDLKRNSKRKTFTQPTLQEVKNYVKEKKLNVDADYFYKYFTEGNWVDSKGSAVRNWKQKLITWDKHNKEPTTKTEKIENTQNFVEVDTSQLTPEEYDMLVKRKITVEELIEKGKINV